MEVFQPEAIVVCGGADSLSGDRLGCFNLSLEGHADCMEFLAKFGVPLLILGGGAPSSVKLHLTSFLVIRAILLAKFGVPLLVLGGCGFSSIIIVKYNYNSNVVLDIVTVITLIIVESSR